MRLQYDSIEEVWEVWDTRGEWEKLVYASKDIANCTRYIEECEKNQR